MDNAILENILRQVRPLIGQGKVADYIPALATVDGSRLGIAICTVDGQLFQAGDAQERFSIQSISKVLSLVVASDILFISLNDRLNDISAVLAGCERIAYTPIPFAYTLILHRTVYLFCIMLPFALVVDLHYMTPFISVLISYTFISLDCLAEELEDPFGNENNDLPLDAICNAIEIDLLQMNDEAEIPAKILPDRHYQLT
ncbi:hypothetical protein G5I65_000562 [Escherichia coli]|nr:hypothetical protein [Escherichia coli]